MTKMRDLGLSQLAQLFWHTGMRWLKALYELEVESRQIDRPERENEALRGKM